MADIESEDDFSYVQGRLASGELTPEEQAQAQKDVEKYNAQGALLDRAVPGLNARTPEDDFASIEKTGKIVQENDAERTAAFVSEEEFNPEGKFKTVGPSHPEDFDGTLKDSASKRKGLYRPSEVIRTKVRENNSSFTGKLAGVFDSLPSSMGGNVDEYFEPTFEQFQGEMEEHRSELQKLGFVNIDNEKDPGTARLFKQYADTKWQEVYDQAEADGRSVSRVAYRGKVDEPNDPEKRRTGITGAIADAIDDPLMASRNALSSINENAVAGSMGALNHGLGVLPGMGDALARGLGGEKGLAQARAAQARNPAADVVGSVAGAASPLAAATRLSTSAAKVAGGIAPGLARGVASTAAAGAAGAGVDAAGNTIVGELAEGGDITTKQFADELRGNVGTATTIGALGGGIGDLIGRGAQAGLKRVRDRTTPRGDDIRKLEDAGGSLGLGGPKRSPKMEKLAQEVGDSPHRTTQEEILANRITPGLVDSASKQGNETIARTMADRARWMKQNPGAEVSAKPFTDRLMTLMNRNRGSDEAGELPLADNEELKKIFNASHVQKEMPIGEANAIVARGEGLIFGKGSTRETAIVGVPRQLNADDIDRVAKLADDLADNMKPSQTSDPEGYKQLAAAIREARDGLPGNYSGMKEGHKKLLADFERDSAHAFGPQIAKRPKDKIPAYDDLIQGEQDAARGKVLGYQYGKDRFHADEAIRKFATDPAIQEELAMIPAADAFQKLQQRSKVIGSPHVGASGNIAGAGRLEGIALRSDPVLKNLASTPVSPKLRDVLRSMRKNGFKKPSPSLSGSLGSITAPGGGALGVRAGAGADSDELSEEDIQNLSRLITEVEREGQGGKAGTVGPLGSSMPAPAAPGGGPPKGAHLAPRRGPSFDELDLLEGEALPPQSTPEAAFARSTLAGALDTAALPVTLGARGLRAAGVEGLDTVADLRADEAIQDATWLAKGEEPRDYQRRIAQERAEFPTASTAGAELGAGLGGLGLGGIAERGLVKGAGLVRKMVPDAAAALEARALARRSARDAEMGSPSANGAKHVANAAAYWKAHPREAEQFEKAVQYFEARPEDLERIERMTHSSSGLNADLRQAASGGAKLHPRGETAERAARTKDALEGALANGVRYDGPVYRGMRLPRETVDEWIGKKYVKNASFLSTTANQAYVTGDVPKIKASSSMVGVTLNIKTRSGVPIGGVSDLPHEHEVLIPPGRTWKMTSHSFDENGHVTMDIEEVARLPKGKPEHAITFDAAGAVGARPTGAMRGEAREKQQNYSERR